MLVTLETVDASMMAVPTLLLESTIPALSAMKDASSKRKAFDPELDVVVTRRPRPSASSLGIAHTGGFEETAPVVPEVKSNRVRAQSLQLSTEEQIGDIRGGRRSTRSSSMSSRGQELLDACGAGKWDRAKLMLLRGAEVNFQNGMGTTPLMAAASRGCVKTLAVLLESGANIALVDRDQQTALHFATRHGHVEAVKLLLEKGADAEVADSDGWRVLHWAARTGNVEMAKLLLQRKVQVNAANEDGQTPLHESCRYGHLAVVNLLLCADADFRLKNAAGDKAITVATNAGHDKIAAAITRWQFS